MISLLSDKAVLMASDFSKSADTPLLLRFRYYADARKTYISPWQLVREASPAVACFVNPLFAAQEKWASISSQDRAEFRRMRKREFSDYLLPEEVFARFKVIYDEMMRIRVAISAAIISQSGADEFCRLDRGEGESAGITFVYRNGTLWSSLRTLTREQWIALIDRARANDEMMLTALTQGSSGIPAATDNRFISIEVRREVWRRDQGTCVKCGSQQRLEFDHMIPVAMGGGSTARNVQLLCENCNRTKGATLG